MIKRIDRLVACLIATSILQACVADGEEAVPSVLVRDSAGATIVESAGPQWGAGSTWRLSLDPEVIIGRDGSDPNHQLFGVRGLARLSDGRIAILNQGTREVRVYSAAGDFLYASGGDGDGPGEMRRTLQMSRGRSDTLVVNALPELEFFDSDGHWTRATRIDWGDALKSAPPGFAFGNVREVLPDGTLFLWVYKNLGSLPEGPFADSIVVMRYSPATNQATVLGRWLYAQAVATEIDGARQVATHPLSLHAAWGVGGSPDDPLIAVGHPEEPEIHLYSVNGPSTRMIRWSPTAGVVRSSDVARAMALEQERLPEQDLPRFNRLMAKAATPALLPFFSDVTVDATGNVWARDFHVNWREATAYTVFDPTGRWLGSVRFPSGLSLGDFDMGPVIGPDWFLGVWKDEFDVEEVRLYRLIKPSTDNR